MDDVLITAELGRRPTRPPDHEAEARALGDLARTLATDPHGLLQQVAEVAMALCRADSAGISVLEPHGEHGILRWRATAGAYAANLNGTMPREASPCGDVMHRNEVLLFDRPERVYPAMRGVGPPVDEALLAPWERAGAPAGTLWVIAHTPARRFDAEDARLLVSLARFAASAWQAVQALQEAEAGRAARAELADLLERAQAEAALRASEERYRALATASADVVYRMSPDWGEMRQLDGRGFLSDTSAPDPMWLGRYIHPDDQARVKAAVDEAVRTRTIFVLEHRVVRADGTIGWTHSRAVPVVGADGGIVEWIGAASDVTVRREAELALRASEAKYRTIFESIDEGFCVIERIDTAPGELPDFRYLETNPAFERHAGLTDVVGRTIREVVPRAETDVLALYDRVVTTGEPIRFEAQVTALDIWIEVHVSRIGAPEDGRAAVVFSNVTERKRAEAALRASEERYRLIVERARDYAIFTTDPDGRIESWSPGAEAVFGWEAAEAVGQPMSTLFVPEDRASGVDAEERATAREAGSAVDVRWHLRKDGARVFIEGMVWALRDEAGGLRGFLKIGQDVTRRRATDEALRASEARYRALVENVHDYAIFLLDAAGRVVEWPEGAQRVKGYAPEEVIGRHLSLFYTPEDVAAGVVDQELTEAVATGRAEREGWRVRKGGERFWVNEIATAVRDSEGRLVAITKISRDLTEPRLAEAAAERAQVEAAREELRRALVGAEEAERRRLARELHDQLGQHLTALALGLADARRRLSAGAAVGGETIVAAPVASTVGASLTQLEDLARVMTRDARALALELRPPELDDVGLESALESYVAEWAARYGIAAEVEVTGLAAGRLIPADVATALYRIVQEALTNVARHSGATQASVIVEKPDGEVGIIVEDDGRGFDVEAAAGRVHAERRLGLASMRERAALVGGTLVIESSPGSGTTLFVRLPVRPVESAAAGRSAEPTADAPGRSRPGRPTGPGESP